MPYVISYFCFRNSLFMISFLLDFRLDYAFWGSILFLFCFELR
ncbi:hypothetical protein SynNOUM97013_01798 [Synechococcus sp. NOUM97013]|nr:hypothetical protein SynNOUM97013_01798 [Synechococcus sp. NOUM97013]